MQAAGRATSMTSKPLGYGAQQADVGRRAWLGLRGKAMELASPGAMMAPPVELVMPSSSYAPDALARSAEMACSG